MSDPPRDWNQRRLADLVRIPNGQVDPRIEPFRSQILIAPDHIASGSGHIIQRETAASQGAISGKYQIFAGDVLYSKIRPALRKAARADFSGICSADMYPLRPSAEIDSGYLLNVILSDRFSEFAESVSGRSGIPKINRTEFEEFWLALPPIAEQRRIAEILDAAEEEIRSTERLIVKLEQAKQGLLRDLLTCGIDEPGNLRDASLHPGQFCNTSLGLLPKEWAVVSIHDVAESVTSGSRAWAAYYAESGALFLRIGNLTRKHINLRLTARSFVRPPMNAELRRTAVQPDDVLISITADLGIIGVVPSSLGEAYVNQHIALVRPTSRALGRWIGYFLSSYRAQAQFAMLNDAGAKAGLNLPAVGRLKIGLPRSVDERERIVAILDAHESEIVTHQASLAKLRSVKQGLMDDLLTGRVRVGASA